MSLFSKIRRGKYLRDMIMNLAMKFAGWFTMLKTLLSLNERKFTNKMVKLKEINHPNILKYLHAELNDVNNEITIITELAGNLK